MGAKIKSTTGLAVILLGSCYYCTGPLPSLLKQRQALTIMGTSLDEHSKKYDLVLKSIKEARTSLESLEKQALELNNTVAAARVENLSTIKACKASADSVKKEVKRKEEEEHWKVVTISREKKTKKEEQLSSIIQTKKAQLRSLKETREKANTNYELSINDYTELEVLRTLFPYTKNPWTSYLDAYVNRLRRGNFRGSFALNKEKFNRSRELYSKASNAWSAEVEHSPEKNTALWSLDKSGDRIELLGVNESALMSFLPDRDSFGGRFPRGGFWHKCALVGKSGSLLLHEQGAEIDGHDAVFRMDEAPVHQFEAHVGTKTTVRIVKGDKLREVESQATSREMVMTLITSKEEFSAFQQLKRKNLKGKDASWLHLLAPDLLFYSSRFLNLRVPWPVYCLIIALQKCVEVTMYGFAYDPNTLIPAHYWDVQSSRPFVDSESVSSLLSRRSPNVQDAKAELTLLSEIQRRFHPQIKFAEPCALIYDHLRHSQDNTRQYVSEGGECASQIPFPLPKPGYCATVDYKLSWAGIRSDASRTASYGKIERPSDHPASINEFRPCPDEKLCKGGLMSPLCSTIES